MGKIKQALYERAEKITSVMTAHYYTAQMTQKDKEWVILNDACEIWDIKDLFDATLTLLSAGEISPAEDYLVWYGMLQLDPLTKISDNTLLKLSDPKAAYAENDRLHQWVIGEAQKNSA